MTRPKAEHDFPATIALDEMFGAALDAAASWIGIVDGQGRVVLSNRAFSEALTDLGTALETRPPVPFPCWDRHAGPDASFKCPCPALETTMPSATAFCRHERARFPSRIASQSIGAVTAPTGYRLIVVEPPPGRLDEPDVHQLVNLLRKAEALLTTLRNGKPETVADASRPPILSTREWELVKRLMAHQRLATVAEGMGISIYTARNHLKSVFRKLNVHSQFELLRHLGVFPDKP